MSKFGQSVVGSRGGRLVKWRGTVASIAPGLVISTVGVLSISTASVLAQVIPTHQTATQILLPAGSLTITPSGSVSVTGTTNAAAIDVAPPFTGDITNQGAIAATVTQSDGSGRAVGISLTGDIVGGSIVNDGPIVVTAEGGSSTAGNSETRDVSASAAGIAIDGTVNDSSITGRGAITITATGGTVEVGNDGVGDAGVSAVGITVKDLDYASSLDISGSITVTAAGGTARAGDDGSAQADAEAVAGIAIAYSVDTGAALDNGSSLVNTGTIIVESRGGTATVEDGLGGNGARAGVHDTHGIRIGNYVENGVYASIGDISNGSALDNSGTITVLAQGGTASGGFNANANVEVHAVYGISVFGHVDDSQLINTGEITVTALGGMATRQDRVPFSVSYYDSAHVSVVYGIMIKDGLGNRSVLDNRGAITLRAEGGTVLGGDNVSARSNVDNVYGIRLYGRIDDGSSLNNTGNITVTALSGMTTVGDGTDNGGYFGFGARANSVVTSSVGISIQHNISNSSVLDNSGVITVLAQAGTVTGGDNARAMASQQNSFGIYLQSEIEYGSSLINTGDITVTGRGGTATAGDSIPASDFDRSARAGTFSNAVDTVGIKIRGRIEHGSVVDNIGMITVLTHAGTANAGDDSGASAQTRDSYGMFFDNGIRDDSSLINTGDITVTALGGIATAGNRTRFLTGAVTDVEETMGIMLDEDIADGSLVYNSGTITVFAQAGTSTAGFDARALAEVEETFGIYLDQGIENDSSLINRGDVTVTALGGTATVGVGALGNSYASASAKVDETIGIFIEDEIQNASQLNNSGAITVLAQGGTIMGGDRVSARADVNETYGIYQLRPIQNDSSLINTGDITVTARGGMVTVGNGSSGRNDASARADVEDTMGITIDRDILNRSAVDNSGAVTVVAQAGSAIAGDNASARARAILTHGVFLDRGISNDSAVMNIGDITVTALGGTATVGDGMANSNDTAAFADVSDTFGLHVDDGVTNNSSLENSGDITVIATGGTATAGANARAIASAEAGGFLSGFIDATSRLDNGGNVTVSATGGTASGAATESDAFAFGLGFDAGIEGDVTNTGNVFAEATAQDGEANAYAVDMSRMGETGSFTSTGNLTGRAIGESGIGAGFYVDGEMDGTATLSGAIRGIGPTQSAADSYAIHLGSGNGALDIKAPTYFVGSLKVADQSVSLTSGQPYSVHWDFDFGAGADFTLIEGSGIPWFSRNGDDQSGEYATFDPSGFETQDQTVARVAGFGDEAMRRHLGVAVVREQAFGDGASAPLAWATIMSSRTDFVGATASSELEVRASGGVAGLALRSDDDLSFGFMAGVVSTAAASDSALARAYEIDGNSAFVGASAAANLDGLMLDAGIKLGRTNMESTRFVNYNLAIAEDGVDRAGADMDARWTGFTLGASFDIPVTSTLTITPLSTASYTRANFDRYAEDGAAANATVTGRSMAVTEGEVGFSVSHRTASGIVQGSLGYVSRNMDGSSMINVILIGDQNAVAVQSRSSHAAKLGLGYASTVNENMDFNVQASILSGDDGFDGQQLSASFNLRF